MIHLAERGRSASSVRCLAEERYVLICKIQRRVESDGGDFFMQETFPERGAAADFDLRVPGYSVVEHLAHNGMSCCTFDHRGYGRSFEPPPRAPLGLEARARDLYNRFLSTAATRARWIRAARAVARLHDSRPTAVLSCSRFG